MGYPYCLRQCQHQQNLLAVLWQGIFEPIQRMGHSFFLDAIIPRYPGENRLFCQRRDISSLSGKLKDGR